MAQLWYKFEKRIKRVSEDVSSVEIKKLKADGYVQVSDRSNPEGSIIEQPKPKSNPKPKAKKKSKKK